MRARTWFGLGLAALLLLPLATFARQTQQPPPPAEKEKPKPPAKKAKKVWTGEDLKDLRTPSDEYTEKKAAAAEQDAKDKEKAAEQKEPAVKEAKPAEQEPADESNFIAPTTVEEAEKRIAEKREEIKYAEDAVRQLREEYINEKNDQIREDLKGRLAKMEKSVEEAVAELDLLEKSLKELKSKGSAPQPESPQRP